MSELPDGLPNTCLDCLETEWTELGGGKYRLVARKNGKTAMMMVNALDLFDPLFDELAKEVE
jgi:hypothetical protein